MAEVTGKHRPGGRTNKHWEDGWNKAVQDALDKMNDQNFPAGEATVELIATINPGNIVEYAVKITSH